MDEAMKFEVQQNTDPGAGPLDGVKAGTQCAVTRFAKNKSIKNQKTHNCAIMCSYETGIFSLSLAESHAMTLHLQLDELVVLLQAGAVAAKGQAEQSKSEKEVSHEEQS